MKKVLLFFILLPLMAFTLHKFYVSTIRVEFKPDNKTLQVTIRIFTDDLQETLNSTYNKNFELDTSNESKEIDSLINNYIKNSFTVKINDNLKEYTYLGKEYNNDMAFLYVEVDDVNNIKSIEIKDSMLMKLFPAQKNIIKLFINNIKKTFFLTSDNDKDSLKLS